MNKASKKTNDSIESRTEGAASPVAIGVLQTDSVREPLIQQFGDYPEMFEQLLQRGAEELGVALEVRSYDVEHGQYPQTTDACDGYVITGSRHSVYDPLPWIRDLEAYVVTLHEERRKLIGICFGHQLIARALGDADATGPASGGWAVGVHESAVVADLPWMQPPMSNFGLLSSHKDQVLTLPPRASLIATNDFCPNAGFVIDDHIVTLQGHPEFNKPYAHALLDMRREILGDELVERGVASLHAPTHESALAHWFIRFVLASDGAETDGSV